MIARVTPDPGGAWLAIAGEHGALLVEHSFGVADELLAALASTDPVQAVLDVLTGAGISRAPDFALVVLDDTGAPRHAVVRGAVLVQVTGEDGVEELTGRNARTWMEYELDGRAMALVAPTDSAAAPSSPTSEEAPVADLPLERGATVGARIAIRAGAEPASAANGSPAAASAVPAVATPAASGTTAGTPVLGAPPASGAVPVAPFPVPIVEHTMVEPEDGAIDYDHLFEATIVRSVEEAAVRPVADEEEAEPGPSAPVTTALPAPAPAGADATPAPSASPIEAPTEVAAAVEDEGDHDGETVLSGDLPSRAARPRPAEHEIAGPAPVRRFSLVLPGDRREPLAGELIVGRAPTARVVDGRVPRLITIEGDPDVSRSHLRVALEGDTVVVTDLRSRNGTAVLLPGKPRQVLRADEPTPVIAGTVLDLGDTTLRVEEEPGGVAVPGGMPA